MKEEKTANKIVGYLAPGIYLAEIIDLSTVIKEITSERSLLILEVTFLSRFENKAASKNYILPNEYDNADKCDNRSKAIYQLYRHAGYDIEFSEGAVQLYDPDGWQVENLDDNDEINLMADDSLKMLLQQEVKIQVAPEIFQDVLVTTLPQETIIPLKKGSKKEYFRLIKEIMIRREKKPGEKGKFWYAEMFDDLENKSINELNEILFHDTFTHIPVDNRDQPRPNMQ